MSLYNKRILVDEHFAHYPEVDVKEAIKELKEKCGLMEDDTFALAIGLDDLIEIFGADLCSGVEE